VAAALLYLPLYLLRTYCFTYCVLTALLTALLNTKRRATCQGACQGPPLRFSQSGLWQPHRGAVPAGAASGGRGR
jgi:hypothetical protein